eukprot:6894898-Pyramimonas_sp.AAC.1
MAMGVVRPGEGVFRLLERKGKGTKWASRQQEDMANLRPFIALVVLAVLAVFVSVADAKDFKKLQIGVKWYVHHASISERPPSVMVHDLLCANPIRSLFEHKPELCTRKAKRGDEVKVHYKGTLTDGTVFDESHQRGSPIRFTLGEQQVIEGWDAGINGMCVGEKRKLKIPSHMGYGDAGSPPTIP